MSVSKIGKNIRTERGLIEEEKRPSHPEPFEVMGIQKTKDGYVFVRMKLRNQQIISVQENGPEVRALTLERMQLALREFVLKTE